ncbi:anaerobic carbon-monoxide dehydrogenase catalytic subunit [Calderihabitans maritimus]|uniref:Carbon monoxide dehydrogenase n=1 Tax=Calderihabitans maritimus TaxID=1246530 RepID=A0A1Z5HUZ4_9FIRM|nr:anaerobic carbon-monoxide dehydrogenase catalytic subunit [Calderihabitans maritimus]GAW93228.1 carbon-monoxide dehydrogenase, catalytic subunit [Calderihabitans maritimus]
MRKPEERTIDYGVQEMLVKAREEGIETAFDRADAANNRCKFGMEGVCCKGCLEGPCRISLNGKGPALGVCGADADSIVARNLLATVVEGAASHAEHGREVVLTLLKAVRGQAPYKIADEEKLYSLASGLGIDTDGLTVNQVAEQVALKALEDFQKQEGVLNWLKLKAQDKTVAKWEKLGILPVNAHLEIAKAVKRQAMGCDADPVNLLKGILTVALVDGYSGLHMSTDLQDVLFGSPQLVRSEYKLGVIKREYVNIMVHGHVPVLSEKVVEWAQKLHGEALQLGAKGINVVGVCCSGNEVLMRRGIPVATNFASQELPIVTGAVDAAVVDAQCIMPGLTKVAGCYHTAVITTMPYVKIPGAIHIEFNPRAADDAAEKIVRLALDRYQQRDEARIRIPEDKIEVYAGFSTKQITGLLQKLNKERPLQPLVEAMEKGDIYGIVALVGCTNPRTKQDWANTEVAKYLMRNNVLIVGTGCAAHSLAKFGLMSPQGVEYCGSGLRRVMETLGGLVDLPALPPAWHMGSCVDNSRIDELLIAVADYLGVEVSRLPVAASSPETHHPKAIAIGSYFLTQGVDVHVGVKPPVGGSELVSKALTAGAGEYGLTMEELFGGKLIVEEDPVLAAQKLLERINRKRKALGLSA